jgi:hypothetical protein
LAEGVAPAGGAGGGGEHWGGHHRASRSDWRCVVRRREGRNRGVTRGAGEDRRGMVKRGRPHFRGVGGAVFIRLRVENPE